MSEKKSPFCTLTDQELIEKTTELIQQLIDTGGKSWVLNIPARPNADPDLIFTELNFRFKNLMERPKGPAWVKASERLPVNPGMYCIKWCGKYYTADYYPASRQFHITSYGSVATNTVEWLDESPAEQPGVSQDAHEKEVMMQAFDKVRQIFEGREWIMEGRGSYPYNDDRYKEEVRYMYDEFDALVKDAWANIKSKSEDYRKAIIDEYKAAEQPVREVEAVAIFEEEVERRNRLLEVNMKLGMRISRPGISEQEQEETWQDYKMRNNL